MYSETPVSSTLSTISSILEGIADDFNDDNADRQYKPTFPVGAQLATQLEQVSSVRSGSRDKLGPGSVALPPNESPVIEDGPPQDKGYAWVVAICAFLAVFATWGANASYGIFLEYYLSHNTYPGASQYDFALIGSLVFFCGLSLSPIAALLYNIFGFRTLAYAGTIIQIAGYILASFSTKLWELYLTQGVMVGIALVLIFLPTTLALPTWFNKYLSTCMGVAVAGIGLGGCVFAFSVNAVIERTGSFRWALRMVGFVSLAACLVSSFFIKPRVNTRPPLSQTLTKEFISTNYKLIFDWKIFKQYTMISLGLWFGLAFLGYVLCLFSLSPFAKSVGLANSQGTVLTALINVGQMVGRPMMGLYADTLGRTNFTILMNIVITILIYGWWMNTSSFGSLIGFSLVSGLFFGVSSTMGQSLAFEIIEDPARLPSAWSVINSVGGFFALVSEVIALKLVKPESPHPYLHPQIFGGACFAAGIVFLLINREWLIRRKFRRRQLDHYDNEHEELDKIKFDTRSRRYNTILQPNIVGYLIRMFYPTSV